TIVYLALIIDGYGNFTISSDPRAVKIAQDVLDWTPKSLATLADNDYDVEPAAPTAGIGVRISQSDPSGRTVTFVFEHGTMNGFVVEGLPNSNVEMTFLVADKNGKATVHSQVGETVKDSVLPVTIPSDDVNAVQIEVKSTGPR